MAQSKMMSCWGERIWLVLSFQFTKFMFCMVPVFVEEEENGKEQLAGEVSGWEVS